MGFFTFMEKLECLNEVFGSYKTFNQSTSQMSFNCPNCDSGRDRGNLEVNVDKDLYACWSCKDEIGGVKGKGVYFLIKRFGGYRLAEKYGRYNKFQARISRGNENYDIVYKLPDEFSNFRTGIKNNTLDAFKYLNETRGIPKEIIIKYNLGCCIGGRYDNRVILPSYSNLGDINYFIARDYTDTSKIKYLNPKIDKKSIIFNDKFVNYNASIYLVEGVFDSIVVPNSIPLLGKSMYPLLHKKLMENVKGYVYILLDDDAHKNAIEIKNTLNFGTLKNKVFVLRLGRGTDPSELCSKIGYKNLQRLLYKRVSEL